MKPALWLFLPGLLFGVGLAVSGMTNPDRVTGFLDIYGDWDPTLAFVMGGAVLSFGAMQMLVQRRGKPLLEGHLPRPPSGQLDSRLLVGATLFGIGWGLGGFCPGPAIGNLGYLRVEALVFVPAMTGGMLIAQHVLGADEDG